MYSHLFLNRRKFGSEFSIKLFVFRNKVLHFWWIGIPSKQNTIPDMVASVYKLCDTVNILDSHQWWLNFWSGHHKYSNSWKIVSKHFRGNKVVRVVIENVLHNFVHFQFSVYVNENRFYDIAYLSMHKNEDEVENVIIRA